MPPVGSKEFHFLDCLASDLDRFITYADLKHHVLEQAGSTDTTEEGTFCQNLKSRIKKKWVPQIDRLISHVMPMSRIQEALELCATHETAKVILKPW